MKIQVCDLCRAELFKEGDVKIKYKAKRFWVSWYEAGWEHIDICQDCLKKIIEVKNE